MLLSFAAVAGSVLATDRSDIPLRSTEGIERVLSFTGTGALVVLLVGILIAAAVIAGLLIALNALAYGRVLAQLAEQCLLAVGARGHWSGIVRPPAGRRPWRGGAGGY